MNLCFTDNVKCIQLSKSLVDFTHKLVTIDSQLKCWNSEVFDLRGKNLGLQMVFNFPSDELSSMNTDIRLALTQVPLAPLLRLNSFQWLGSQFCSQLSLEHWLTQNCNKLPLQHRTVSLTVWDYKDHTMYRGNERTQLTSAWHAESSLLKGIKDSNRNSSVAIDL